MRALWTIYSRSIAEAAKAEEFLASATTRQALRQAADPLVLLGAEVRSDASRSGVVWARAGRRHLEHPRREAAA